MGGKYKILDQVFATFPSEINYFVDLFAGGLNVGINVNAKKIIANDHLKYVIELYKYLQSHDTSTIISEINKRIDEFQLSKTNKDGYLKIRERYNSNKDIVDFLVLIFYSFSHQIRFNKKFEFNVSFGKNLSGYNNTIEKNLIEFCSALHKKPIDFYHKDFLELDLTKLNSNDLVYCDPPYLISTASYNESGRGFKGWSEKEEKELLDLLDQLDEQGVKFALSNVLYHKGLSNDLLIEWSKKYNIHYIEKSYSNCNYQLKENNNKTVEVLITNYRV